MRDGIPSANTVSMFNADGVKGENNFFSRQAWNHIDFPGGVFGRLV